MTSHQPLTGTRLSPWEARYRLALNGPHESWLLRRLATQMEAAGDSIWTVVWDLADGVFDDDRSEAYAEIDAYFATEPEPTECLFGGFGETDLGWRASPAAERAGMGEG